MHTITTNLRGTRSIDVGERHLETIRRYGLLDHLTGSTGVIDEEVLDKLKLSIRSLITAKEGDCTDLLNLCIDVVYHDNMKAFGLQQLIGLYNEWAENNPAPDGNLPQDEETACEP